MGVGITRSEPYEDEHFTDPKRTAMYVKVRWTDLRETPLIGWAELQRAPFKGFRWGIQGSGVELPHEIAEALEGTWKTRTGVAVPGLPEEMPAGERFVEGAQKSVTVNAYERDPGARAACLAVHGYACAVCDERLEDRYGAIAREFIHVHHVTTIAKIGKAYEVDPVKDLRPVCPNCHAILHRKDPPLSIDAARKLVRK
jgi:5-methylcytosine-specific restriction protein A